MRQCFRLLAGAVLGLAVGALPAGALLTPVHAPDWDVSEFPQSAELPQYGGAPVGGGVLRVCVVLVQTIAVAAFVHEVVDDHAQSSRVVDRASLGVGKLVDRTRFPGVAIAVTYACGERLGVRQGFL